MYGKIKEHLQRELAEIEAAGLYKRERVIESPQRAAIEVAGREVLNFCANNYLGLSDNPRLIEAWFSASEMIASSSVNSGSKTPPLASKHAA